MARKKKKPEEAKVQKDFSKPLPVKDVDIAFPAHALDYMPAWEDIPDVCKHREHKWSLFFHDWFFNGRRMEGLEFDLKEGIDGEMAMRHLRVVCGSFAPKHEHKVAAFSHLCSLWFNDVRYTLKEHGAEERKNEPI